MNNTNTDSNQNTNKRPSRKGNLNPMWGKKMSQATRERMSQSHKAYQERIRQAQQQRPMTMDEFLGNNKDLDIKGYIKSLMQKEGLLKEIIREEINKLYDTKLRNTSEIQRPS